MTIEADPNPMPQFRIMPPMEGIRSAIDRARSLGRVTEVCLSEHVQVELVQEDGRDVAQV